MQLSTTYVNLLLLLVCKEGVRILRLSGSNHTMKRITIWGNMRHTSPINYLLQLSHFWKVTHIRHMRQKCIPFVQLSPLVSIGLQKYSHLWMASYYLHPLKLKEFKKLCHPFSFFLCTRFMFWWLYYITNMKTWCWLLKYV